MRVFAILCIASLAFSGCLSESKDNPQGLIEDLTDPLLDLVITHHTVEGTILSVQTPVVAVNANGLLGEPVTHEFSVSGDVQNITMNFTGSGEVGAFEARILIAYPDCATADQLGNCAEEVEFVTEGLKANEVLPDPLNGTYTVRVFIQGEQDLVGADEIRFSIEFTSEALERVEAVVEEAS